MAYRNAEEQVSKKLREKILKRDNYTCKYCGKKFPAEYLQIDHIRPVCLGGDNRESNLTTSCWKCNNEKGTKRIIEFEDEKDRTELDERYRQKVRNYGYYTNYIKKVFASNGFNSSMLSRPQIDRYVKANIKNDEDFEVFKMRLKEIGVEGMKKELFGFFVSEGRKRLNRIKSKEKAEKSH